MAIAFASEAEMEMRVGSQAKYRAVAADRPDGIDFHGRHFFVSSIDWWRGNLTVYLLVAGGFLIVAGRRLREAK